MKHWHIYNVIAKKNNDETFYKVSSFLAYVMPVRTVENEMNF